MCKCYVLPIDTRFAVTLSVVGVASIVVGALQVALARLATRTRVYVEVAVLG